MSSPKSRQDAESAPDPETLRPKRTRRGTEGARSSGEPSSGKSERSETQRSEQQPQARPGPAGPSLGWSFRDFVIPYILLALSIQKAHGYFIEQYLRGLGLINVEMSTLYRTLRQLERDGLVFSTWEPGPDGPARRVYCLTDSGRWWLDSSAAALEGHRALIERFFGSYSGRSAGRTGGDREKGASQ